MSGTRLDGVDAVLADFSTGVPRLSGSIYQPYSAALRTIENIPGNAPEVTGVKGPRIIGAIYPP